MFKNNLKSDRIFAGKTVLLIRFHPMRFVCVEKRTVSVNRFLSNNDEFLFFFKLSAVSLFCHHIFSESFFIFYSLGH